MQTLFFITKLNYTKLNAFYFFYHKTKKDALRRLEYWILLHIYIYFIQIKRFRKQRYAKIFNLAYVDSSWPHSVHTVTFWIFLNPILVRFWYSIINRLVENMCSGYDLSGSNYILKDLIWAQRRFHYEYIYGIYS